MLGRNAKDSSGEAGLSTVATDDTIDGDGSSGSPLKVAEPYTAAERTKLAGVEEGAQKNIGVEYTQTEKDKLGNVESNATADQSATEIRDALQTLSGGNRLAATAIKDLPSGGGLSTVATDNTITGNGTSGSPLKVANPFTDADERKLDSAITNTGSNKAEKIRRMSKTQYDNLSNKANDTLYIIPV